MMLSEKEEGFISGLLFGLGIGIIIGYYILWPVHVVEDGSVHVERDD